MLGPIVVFVNHMNFGLHGIVPLIVTGRLGWTNHAGTTRWHGDLACAVKLRGLTGWPEYAEFGSQDASSGAGLRDDKSMSYW